MEPMQRAAAEEEEEEEKGEFERARFNTVLSKIRASNSYKNNYCLQSLVGLSTSPCSSPRNHAQLPRSCVA